MCGQEEELAAGSASEEAAAASPLLFLLEHGRAALGAPGACRCTIVGAVTAFVVLLAARASDSFRPWLIHQLVEYRAVVLVCFACPVSVLVWLQNLLRSRYAELTATPERHDERVAAVQQQVRCWAESPPEGRRPMCTARSNWQVRSPQGVGGAGGRNPRRPGGGHSCWRVHDAPLTCTGVGADDSEPLHPLREQGRAAQDRARCAPRCAGCPPALGIIVIIAPLPWSQRLLGWLRHAQLPPPPPTTGALRDVLEIRAPPAQRGTVRVEPSVTVGHITRRLEPTHMLAVRAAACPSPLRLLRLPRAGRFQLESGPF